MIKHPEILCALISFALLAGCATDPQGTSTPEPLQPARHARAQATAQLGGVEEKKIPYSEVLQYPPNWPEIVESREAQPPR